MWNTLSQFIFGRAIEHQLPARIRTAIQDQESQAEILIGWLQLAVVVFFFAVYTVSPKTSSGTPFMPVPYVLGAFLLFAATRLVLAHNKLLPRWFVGASVIIDIGLLLGLIWSFHLQYQQPPAFYLKAPTLLYVFIFIALRSLRFNPAYVLIAGLAAAAGWSAMAWYAIDVGGPGTITHDYVHYMTSNTALIGAEVDKVITILVVTLVIVLALVRARRLLHHAVNDEAVARDLRRFVAPEVTTRVVSAEKIIRPGDAESKTASVLFSDIEGFSTISERMTPVDLMGLLNEYFDAVSRIVERHHGVIHQFQGDATLITFNTARPDAEHARHALATALDIQGLATARTFGPGITLRTRCGVNTGPLVAGAVGTDERLLYTVYGDEVNIAARLEQLNKQHGTYILATESTLLAAGAPFNSHRRIGEVTVKGRQTPVTVFAIGPLIAAPQPIAQPELTAQPAAAHR
jgi:adenylate cyclase